MQERGELIRRTLVDDLRSLAPALKAALGPFGDEFDVGASDGIGRKTEAPWVRFFARSMSPNPRSGFYCVTHFAADGSAAFITVGCGATEWADGELRDQPEAEVSAKTTWARQLILDRYGTLDPLSDRIELGAKAPLPRAFERATALAHRVVPSQATEAEIEAIFVAAAERLRVIYEGQRVGSDLPTARLAESQKRPPLPAKNIILYGPPGTGKTYRLCTEYLDRFTERGTPKSKEQFADDLVADMAWWEVSTLVLLDMKTAKVSDMLAHPLMQARIRRSATKNLRSALWAHLQSHTKRECEDVAYTNRYEPLIFWKSKESVWSIDDSLAASEVPELPEALQRWKTYKPTAGDVTRRYEFTTFHQSYSYEDFVEGIKPVLDTEGTGDLRYEIKPGVLRQIAKRADDGPRTTTMQFSSTKSIAGTSPASSVS